MSPVLQLILNALIKYVTSHPDQIEKIVELLVQHLIEAITPKPQA